MDVSEVARFVRDLAPEQRARVVHIEHAPAGAVYIGRWAKHGPTRWGNPIPLEKPYGTAERKGCLRAYVAGQGDWPGLLNDPDTLVDLPQLRGKVLACHCRRPGRDVLCHGLVLLALAEGVTP